MVCIELLLPLSWSQSGALKVAVEATKGNIIFKPLVTVPVIADSKLGINSNPLFQLWGLSNLYFEWGIIYG